jgi:hypothetical protein
MKREWKTIALILAIQTAEKDSRKLGKDLVERERAGEPPSGLHAHCTMPASLVT